ncbi:PREDICTED: uncharacterized protein LOC109327748 [Lupinus angustifolius]|uniref:uncharacterized protein LOC109327748 n=1 Tax=Lupinus angustifolius TaxID=3871 RepID=UPI00092F82F3|nr:PREDICTED: uncharacterized protein LOC109327748 [Lupinus angustifolius]
MIDAFLTRIGFIKCYVEYGVYIKKCDDRDMIIICLYVDDLLITGSNKAEIAAIKKSLSSEFEMSDLGRLAYFLGIEFVQHNDGIFMHQKKYILEVLERFNLLKCNSADTPVEANLKLGACEEEAKVDGTVFRQLVGCLRFLCHSRPEISFGVGLVSRHMSSPRHSHLFAAKRILRYLKGTLDHGVLFPYKKSETKQNALHLEAYTDSDWCGDQSSKKQDVVALSTCEAEYIAACNGACQGVWIQALMKELSLSNGEAVEVKVDNQSAINLAKNLVFHGRSKHIETKFHYLRDQVAKGKIKLQHYVTNLQIADVLTKPLKIARFRELRDKMNVKVW